MSEGPSARGGPGPPGPGTAGDRGRDPAEAIRTDRADGALRSHCVPGAAAGSLPDGRPSARSGRVRQVRSTASSSCSRSRIKARRREGTAARHGCETPSAAQPMCGRRTQRRGTTHAPEGYGGMHPGALRRRGEGARSGCLPASVPTMSHTLPSRCRPLRGDDDRNGQPLARTESPLAARCRPHRRSWRCRPSDWRRGAIPKRCSNGAGGPQTC